MTSRAALLSYTDGTGRQVYVVGNDKDLFRPGLETVGQVAQCHAGSVHKRTWVREDCPVAANFYFGESQLFALAIEIGVRAANEFVQAPPANVVTRVSVLGTWIAKPHDDPRRAISRAAATAWKQFV